MTTRFISVQVLAAVKSPTLAPPAHDPRAQDDARDAAPATRRQSGVEFEAVLLDPACDDATPTQRSA